MGNEQRTKNRTSVGKIRSFFASARFARLLPCIIVLLILLCTVFALFRRNSYTDACEGQLEIAFLDVGQGDATLMILPDGGVVLIDCAEQENADAVCRALLRRGLLQIDHLVLTHPHADHVGGGAQLAERFEVKNIWMTETDSVTYELSALLYAAERRGTVLHTIAAGDLLPTGTVRTEVLSPPAGVNAGENNDSVILLIAYNKVRFLLMGDAEAEAEAGINCGRVDLLRVGHHGSDTSTTAAFLRRNTPGYAVVSGGTANDYGHPHYEVLRRLENVNAVVLRTDTNGEILARTDGTELHVKTEK